LRKPLKKEKIKEDLDPSRTGVPYRKVKKRRKVKKGKCLIRQKGKWCGVAGREKK